jgi:hypothetical protein
MCSVLVGSVELFGAIWSRSNLNGEALIFDHLEW